jgi:hypothetical protein
VAPKKSEFQDGIQQVCSSRRARMTLLPKVKIDADATNGDVR